MRSTFVFLFKLQFVITVFAATSTKGNMSMKPKFALVSWLEDDSVGVVPLSAAKDGEKVYPGAMLPIKFQRKYYDAEILKISGNKTELNKNCKDLVEFKLTREDFLNSETPAAELEEDILKVATPDPPTVDSTTAEEPPGLVPAAKRLKNSKKAKQQTNATRKPTTSAAKITAAKERANRMFKERKMNENKDSREDCSIIGIDGEATQWKPPATSAFSSAELLQMLEAQKKEIEELQDTLRLQKAGKTASPPAPWPHNQTEQAAPLPSTPHMQTGQTSSLPLNAGYWAAPEQAAPLPSTPHMQTGKTAHAPLPLDAGYSAPPQVKYTKANVNLSYPDEQQFMDENFYPEDINFNSKWESTPTNPMNVFSKKVNKRLEYSSTAKIDFAAEKSQNPLQEKVELVPGYNVYISPRQLDEVVSASGRRPTRLMRTLLTAFFDNNTLASSCALGSRERPAINPNIRDACIKYVQNNHKEIARTALIDTINDKCAQCRRNLKKAKAM